VLVLGDKSGSVQTVAGRGESGQTWSRLQPSCFSVSEKEGDITGGVGGVSQVYGMGLGGTGDGI